MRVFRRPSGLLTFCINLVGLLSLVQFLPLQEINLTFIFYGHTKSARAEIIHPPNSTTFILRVLSPIDSFSVARRSGQNQARVLSLVSNVVEKNLFRKVSEAAGWSRTFSTMAMLKI